MRPNGMLIVVLASKVSIPRKGNPLCGDLDDYRIGNINRTFQYRERVTPFAAHPAAAITVVVSIVSIPRKGNPLCGAIAANTTLPTLRSFNTAKG